MITVLALIMVALSTMGTMAHVMRADMAKARSAGRVVKSTREILPRWRSR